MPATASTGVSGAQGKVAQPAVIAGEPQGTRVRKLLKLWLRRSHSNLSVDLIQKELTEPSWQIFPASPARILTSRQPPTSLAGRLVPSGNPRGNTVQHLYSAKSQPVHCASLFDFHLLSPLATT
jgi:hypothetical protein